MWSMSMSWASVQVAPSYGENHVPETAAQRLSCWTSLPSRLRTTSRVLHCPYWVIQCGNFDRLYPSIEPSACTVSLPSSARAVVASGGVGGAACAAGPFRTSEPTRAASPATTAVRRAAVRRA